MANSPSPPSSSSSSHTHTRSRSGATTPGPQLEDTRLLDASAFRSPSGSPPNPQQNRLPTRTASTGSFVSSPLNPTFNSARPSSRSSAILNQHKFVLADDPASPQPTSTTHLLRPSSLNTNGTSRGSMVLYRLADPRDSRTNSDLRDSRFPSDPFADPLIPPRAIGSKRNSIISSSGDSLLSLSDSKYPVLGAAAVIGGTPRGFVPYEYDPAADELDPTDEEDMLHDPLKGVGLVGAAALVWKHPKNFPWRGVLNVSMLVLLLSALLTLFVFYPMFSFFRNRHFNDSIDGNIRINGTGQQPVLFGMPDLIDIETPQSARSRPGSDGFDYELVFSDEFNTDGRTFYPGDDPFWEAADIWYGATGDMEWYDPMQVTTRNGSLVITMDSTSTLTSGGTPNSTAPFTAADNHGLDYRSGMLQSWNKFCFTSGYIEVSVNLPGPDQNTQGYWPGAWTMGNLARPGYGATTDGMWPYSYDSCDVGTFPNQTDKDGLGPQAALHSDASRSKYNFELSWLTGQRLSSCSCPNGDHPGPNSNSGRGSPEIDIFEAEKDKVLPVGQVASQSAQFAPFSHDYVYLNDTADEWALYGNVTRPNVYKGSAVQQAISSLVTLPEDMFQGSPGRPFKTMAFEYWGDPSSRDTNYIYWYVDGQPTYRVGAASVGPDQGAEGSGVGQRLIPEEPMSIILNLGISTNWQTIDLTSMIFPAEMLVDYVRVYQRKGNTNIGCNPQNYPTADYINNHMDQYTNPNLTTWTAPKPVNSLYNGGC